MKQNKNNPYPSPNQILQIKQNKITFPKKKKNNNKIRLIKLNSVQFNSMQAANFQIKSNTMRIIQISFHKSTNHKKNTSTPFPKTQTTKEEQIQFTFNPTNQTFSTHLFSIQFNSKSNSKHKNKRRINSIHFQSHNSNFLNIFSIPIQFQINQQSHPIFLCCYLSFGGSPRSVRIRNGHHAGFGIFDRVQQRSENAPRFQQFVVSNKQAVIAPNSVQNQN
jgi:hypothetical protein